MKRKGQGRGEDKEEERTGERRGQGRGEDRGENRGDERTRNGGQLFDANFPCIKSIFPKKDEG